MQTLFSAAAPNSISLLSMGPLTDFAAFFSAQPQFMNRVAKMTVFGGAFNVYAAGNVVAMYPPNKLAEMNVFFDPEAAKFILEKHPFPLVLATLDAAQTVPVTTTIRAQLAALVSKSIAHDVWVSAVAQAFNYSAFAYSTGAALAAAEPSVVFSRANIMVDVVSSSSIGATASTPALLTAAGQVRKLAGDSGKSVTGVVLKYATDTFWQKYFAIQQLPLPSR